MTIANYIFGKYNLIWGCRLYLVILLFYYDNPTFSVTFSVNIIVTRERRRLICCNSFFYQRQTSESQMGECIDSG